MYSVYVSSFWGLHPRPQPGLCPWTPLGASVPRPPVLSTPLANFWLRPWFFGEKTVPIVCESKRRTVGGVDFNLAECRGGGTGRVELDDDVSTARQLGALHAHRQTGRLVCCRLMAITHVVVARRRTAAQRMYVRDADREIRRRVPCVTTTLGRRSWGILGVLTP